MPPDLFIEGVQRPSEPKCGALIELLATAGTVSCGTSVAISDRGGGARDLPFRPGDSRIQIDGCSGSRASVKGDASLTKKQGTRSEPSRSDSAESLRDGAECRPVGCRREESRLQ